MEIFHSFELSSGVFARNLMSSSRSEANRASYVTRFPLPNVQQFLIE